jgi:hypothetical protein
MSDGPSHYVLLEKDGVVLRRLGPTHLGRAHRVKSNLEHRLQEGETIRITDNPKFDPETGQERVDDAKASRTRPGPGDEKIDE